MMKPGLKMSKLQDETDHRSLYTSTLRRIRPIERQPQANYTIRPPPQEYEAPHQINADQVVKNDIANRVAASRDTTKLEQMIRKRIDADQQLSSDNIRTTTHQKYVLGDQMICAQSIMTIPVPVKTAYQNAQKTAQQQRRQTFLVYGYLRKCNSIYYIVETELFIFNIDQLRNSRDHGSDIHQRSIKISPGCRKITETQLGMRMIQASLRDHILVFEYSYMIQICSYKIGLTEEVLGIQKIKKRSFTLISLTFRIKLEHKLAQFITCTKNNQLFFVNQWGNLNYLTLDSLQSFQNKNQWIRKFKMSCERNKKRFTSDHRPWLQKSFRQAAAIFDSYISLNKPRKRNLDLILDQKKNRVYILLQSTYATEQSVIQISRKIIKVYDISYPQNCLDRTNTCKLQVQEDQIIEDLFKSTQIDNNRLKIFGIQKVQSDFINEADLIILLRNGTKAYIKIVSDQIRLVKYVVSPDHQKLIQSHQQRNKVLLSTSQFNGSNNDFKELIKKTYKIKSNIFFNNGQIIKASYHNRSTSLFLVSRQRDSTFYLSVNNRKSENCELYPIKWMGQLNPIQDSAVLPSQNMICQMDPRQRMNNSLNQKKPHYLFSTQMDIKKSITKQRKGSQDQIEVSECHVLVSQVHFPPASFMYVTNRILTSITVLRPIDICYHFIRNFESKFNQVFLSSILHQYSLEDIASMLIQLYVNGRINNHNISQGYSISQHYSQKIKAQFSFISQDIKTSNKYQFSRQRHYNDSHHYEHYERSFKLDKDDVVSRVDPALTNRQREIIINIFRQICNDSKFNQDNSFSEIQIDSSKVQDLNVTATSQTVQLQSKYRYNQSHKNMYSSCVLYISRVMHPFWGIRVKTLNRQSLMSIIQKVESLFQIGELIKLSIVSEVQKIMFFFTKCIQTLHMFLSIPHIPQDMTLQKGLKQPLKYFQQYIFLTIRRDNKVEIINQWKKQFPLFIDDQFRIIVQLYHTIDKCYSSEDIMKSLLRLPAYPAYFINYLKDQKKLKQVGRLKIKGYQPNENVLIKVPKLPFEQLINYFLQKIKSAQIPINQKFIYIQMCKDEIDKDLRNKQFESTRNGHKNRGFFKELNYLEKSLRLQQQCTIQFLKNRQQKEKKQSSQSFVSIFKKMFKKQEDRDVASRQNILKRKVVPQKIIQQNIQIHEQMTYSVLDADQLKRLIQSLGCSYLSIAHIMIFDDSKDTNISKKSSIDDDFIKLQTIKMFQNIIKKYKIQMTKIEDRRKMKIQIMNQIKLLFFLLNRCRINLNFCPIFTGLMESYLKIEHTIKNITEDNKQSNFYIAKQMINLGLDEKLVYKYYRSQIDSILRINPQIFTKPQNRHIGVQITKKFIYLWFQFFQLVQKNKAIQLPYLHQKTKSFNKIAAEVLNYRNQLKTILIKAESLTQGILSGQKGNKWLFGKRQLSHIQKMIQKIVPSAYAASRQNKITPQISSGSQKSQISNVTD